jgi:hypothetical protein
MDAGSALDLVVSLNTHRRHLTTAQRAFAAEGNRNQITPRYLMLVLHPSSRLTGRSLVPFLRKT